MRACSTDDDLTVQVILYYPLLVVAIHFRFNYYKSIVKEIQRRGEISITPFYICSTHTVAKNKRTISITFKKGEANTACELSLSALSWYRLLPHLVGESESR